GEVEVRVTGEEMMNSIGQEMVYNHFVLVVYKLGELAETVLEVVVWYCTHSPLRTNEVMKRVLGLVNGPGTDNQEKDEKQSQNDKTGLGMEKTVKDKAKSKPERLEALGAIRTGFLGHSLRKSGLGSETTKIQDFVEKFLGTVRFGNNDFAVIAGYGDVVIGSMTIKKVYYVEDLLTGDRSSNLYTIALNEIASNSSACLLAKASSSQSWLWHQRKIIGNIKVQNAFAFESATLSSSYGFLFGPLRLKVLTESDMC
ncbi:hypothetical protein Tco_0699579, partial [Tanacetum coccineum]